jgi:hypothetical protein
MKPTPPWVGAYVGEQGKPNIDWQAAWDDADRAIGPLRYWRCFDNTIQPPREARFTAVTGARVFYSLKPPGGDVAGFAKGEYAAAYRRLVAALPADAKMTVWHEPENDLSGRRFAALTRRAYDDLKAVRPDVEYWTVAMAYQWETNSKGNVGSAAGWIDAARHVDAVGIDIYAPRWDFRPMRADRGFQRWLDAIAEASGKPWGVIERGISGHAGHAARTDILADDWSHLTGGGGSMFLYWQADWSGGDWKLEHREETALYRRIAAAGRKD